ncbi:hypothetical protein QJQ45_026454 [Haematococcus lacustris]|nr:hypothetical protein QJQ45_020229 [Haematococcus lacustris]KAJ9533405.1 hypothetical protein QJQ45_026454 [Haematococcus lacustris]
MRGVQLHLRSAPRAPTFHRHSGPHSRIHAAPAWHSLSKDLLWQVLLLSDGSVTRHLQLMTGRPVSVDCLDMSNIGSRADGLPPGVSAIPGPWVQRQVLLRPQPLTPHAHHTDLSTSSCVAEGSGEAGPSRAGPPLPLVYACSWWAAGEVDGFLAERSLPIWMSLSQKRVELYRQVQHVYHGHCPQLEATMGCQGPFWGRQYFFWHNGQPLTLIYEIFSPRMAEYLGSTELAR